jgi:hypothetical protein
VTSTTKFSKTEQARTTYKGMLVNLQRMRAMVHQLITHPQVDDLPDSHVFEVLASYRAVVNSTIEVNDKLQKLYNTGAHNFRGEHRLATLRDDASNLRRGTF